MINSVQLEQNKKLSAIVKHKQKLKTGLVVFLALLFLIAIQFFHIFFNEIYINSNKLSLHYFLESLILNLTFFIAIHGWLLYPFRMSSRQLLISALFLSIGILDLLHVFFHDDLNLFANNNALNSSATFWLMARLTESLGVFIIFSLNKKKLENCKRKVAYTIVLLYTLVISISLIFLDWALSIFGVKEVKSLLGIIVIILYLITIYIIQRKYKAANASIRRTFSFAAFFLILATIVFSYFQHINDYDYFLGSIYRIIAYYYILRVIFINNIKQLFEERRLLKKDVKATKKVYLVEAFPSASTYFADIAKEENESLERSKLLLQYFNQYKNLQTLIDSIPIAFLAIDNNLQIIAFNNKILSFLDLADDENLIGKHLSYITEKIGYTYEKSIIYKALQGNNVVNEHRLVKGSHFLVNAYPIIDSNGQCIIGAVALYQDITELEILRSEMGNFERLNLVGQMAASITHEIRNPMATVRGFIQLLNEQKQGNDTYFSIILNELDRANGIISDFLSLSQNRILEMNECNLNDIIRELQPIIMADTNIKGQFFILELDEQLPNLKLNQKEIKQLILNLTRNATEAMNVGGTLIISTGQDNGKIKLTISDTGSGISKEQIDKVFQPFFTTKPGGTGLGLSVTKSIVDKHHGKIQADSEQGKGTTFIVTI